MIFAIVGAENAKMDKSSDYNKKHKKGKRSRQEREHGEKHKNHNKGDRHAFKSDKIPTEREEPPKETSVCKESATSQSRDTSMTDSTAYEFEWEAYKFHLDRIFFHNDGLLRGNSQQHYDFWNFLKKYTSFMRRQAASKQNKPDNASKAVCSSKIAITDHVEISPIYNHAHKLNFSLKIDRDPTAYADIQGKRESYCFFSFTIIIVKLFHLLVAYSIILANLSIKSNILSLSF